MKQISGEVQGSKGALSQLAAETRAYVSGTAKEATRALLEFPHSGVEGLSRDWANPTLYVGSVGVYPRKYSGNEVPEIGATIEAVRIDKLRRLVNVLGCKYPGIELPTRQPDTLHVTLATKTDTRGYRELILGPGNTAEGPIAWFLDKKAELPQDQLAVAGLVGQVLRNTHSVEVGENLEYYYQKWLKLDPSQTIMPNEGAPFWTVVTNELFGKTR